jgi:hypothetical protein
MTCDRNPKPVQFIQPNVLNRTRLSVGKDDGFADQFRLRLAVSLRIFDARRFTDGIARPYSAEPSVQSGLTATLVPTLSPLVATLSR